MASEYLHIKIQQAHIQQAENIFEMYVHCREKMRTEGIFQWTDHYPNMQTLLQDISAGDLHILIYGNQINGAVALNRIQDEQYKTVNWMDQGENILVVHRLAVHPQSQNKGYAKLLMDYAEDFALSSGCSSIRLDAFSANTRALGIYTGRGYQKRGEVFFPGRELPFYCYEKQIR